MSILLRAKNRTGVERRVSFLCLLGERSEARANSMGPSSAEDVEQQEGSLVRVWGWVCFPHMKCEGGAVSRAPSLAGVRFSLSFLGYYWT
jgi:hypothetical protein